MKKNAKSEKQGQIAQGPIGKMGTVKLWESK
jgi:hypothetical protein